MTIGIVKAWAYVTFDDYEIEYKGELFSASGKVKVTGEYSCDADCGYRGWEPDEVEEVNVSWYRYDKSTDDYIEEDTIPKEVIDDLYDYCRESSFDYDLDWEEEW